MPLINGSLDSLPRNLVVENVILCFTEEDLSRMRDLSAGDTSRYSVKKNNKKGVYLTKMVQISTSVENR